MTIMEQDPPAPPFPRNNLVIKFERERGSLSPTSGANLKPWPLHGEPTTTRTGVRSCIRANLPITDAGTCDAGERASVSDI